MSTRLRPTPIGNPLSVVFPPHLPSLTRARQLLASLDRRVDEGARPLVLIVDDDPAARRILCLQLTSRGIAIQEAESGIQALDHPALAEADLIILDQRMPGLSGLQTAAEVRARGLANPILLFSGYADEVEREARELGIRAIQKGEWDLLFATVQSIVNTRENTPDGNDTRH